MPTSPQIMPLTPPMNVGLRSRPKPMSRMIQVIIATAVARLVLITAAAASAPAKYGSPPLKPFQPSQDAGSHGDEQQVVRDSLLPVTSQPRADHRRSHEARHARGEMDHVATAEVQGALTGPEP